MYNVHVMCVCSGGVVGGGGMGWWEQGVGACKSIGQEVGEERTRREILRR